MQRLVTGLRWAAGVSTALGVLLNCWVALVQWGLVGLAVSIVLAPVALFVVPVLAVTDRGFWLPVWLCWVVLVAAASLAVLLRRQQAFPGWEGWEEG
jgi:hypothetical protein